MKKNFLRLSSILVFILVSLIELKVWKRCKDKEESICKAYCRSCTEKFCWCAQKIKRFKIRNCKCVGKNQSYPAFPNFEKIK